MNYIRIKDIFNSSFHPETFTSQEPKYEKDKILNIRPKDKRKWKKFEIKVINYFINNREKLGIKHVYKLKNFIIDGILELNESEIVLLELKYALNWFTCSVARIEFLLFLNDNKYAKKRKEIIQNKKLLGALIVFNHFKGAGWERKPKKHRYKNGWNYFYDQEKILFQSMNIKTRIARFDSKEKLIWAPIKNNKNLTYIG